MYGDFDWFKKYFFQYMNSYEVEYRFFENGDYGFLNQVIFNSTKRGGEIDFWEDGTFSMHMWDYEKNVELLNVLLRPNKNNEKQNVFEQLKKNL